MRPSAHREAEQRRSYPVQQSQSLADSSGSECHRAGIAFGADDPTFDPPAVFAALADVRNGYGFAGVPTHEAIKPISEARGLPEDRTTSYGEDADGEFVP